MTKKGKVNKLLASVDKVLNQKLSQMKVTEPKKKTKKKRSRGRSRSSTFGSVSSVVTAPVAIGNSLRGASKRVTNLKNGVCVKGRDYMSSVIGSGSVTTWCCVAGTPITPVAFVDSTVSNLARLYQKFRFKYIAVHYITSSPTSSNGDVLIYYSDNRETPFPNQTSANFLPFMFTDDCVVMGPQWTNHSAVFPISADWKYTDYGTHSGINEFACGEVFLFSKTSTTDSPGYLLFDYELEFAEHRVSTRMLTFPITRVQYTQINLGQTTTAVTSGNALVAGAVGNNLSGTASALPSGFAAGDIYRCVVDLTNSTPGSWVNCTTANLMKEILGGFSTAFTLESDGYTIYAVAINATTFRFFQNLEMAFAGTNNIAVGVSATVTWNLQCWISFVGSSEYAFSKSNF